MKGSLALSVPLLFPRHVCKVTPKTSWSTRVCRSLRGRKGVDISPPSPSAPGCDAGAGSYESYAKLWAPSVQCFLS